jgi:hypothetical protein
MIHHLTFLKCLDSIIKYGLLSRKKLSDNEIQFKDTANSDILGKRENLQYDNYIPFHITKLEIEYGIPYNFEQLKKYGDDKIFLRTKENLISDKERKYVCFHPLNKYSIECDDFTDLIKKIDENRQKMLDENNRLDYRDKKVQQLFMSEVLIFEELSFDRVYEIAVANELKKSEVLKILKENNISNISVTINERLFRKR